MAGNFYISVVVARFFAQNSLNKQWPAENQNQSKSQQTG